MNIWFFMDSFYVKLEFFDFLIVGFSFLSPSKMVDESGLSMRIRYICYNSMCPVYCLLVAYVF